MAAELERKGNALFVDEDYDAALECYTQGLGVDRSNASLYTSRAAAHLKLENFLGKHFCGSQHGNLNKA